MRLSDCHNHHDFRRLAERRLPGPIFNYIDGAADDESTYRRNTAAFEACDLVPSVLRGAPEVDLSVTVMGQKLAVPFYCSPTALQRLFHHRGEHAVAAAAARHGTLFGVSSLGTVSLEELRRRHATPQVYQFYFHKDRGLNRAMMQRAKEAGVEVMMLTVDSITGGNRERDKRTGFSIPFRLTLAGLMQFALKPAWGINYVTHERFRLPQLDAHIDMGSGSMSIGRYFTEMLDPTMNWDDVAEMVREWGGPFCLKGVMSVADARRAADIGCAGVVLSNHGGRQLDGSRSAFDQLAEVVDAVGDRHRRDDGRRRAARQPCAQGAVARRQGGGPGALLPLPAGGGRSARRGPRARPDARRGAARHEADGLPLGRRAQSQQSALSLKTAFSQSRKAATSARCAAACGSTSA
jgi:L-lactate dehydrogenase (cytochrome)